MPFPSASLAASAATSTVISPSISVGGVTTRVYLVPLLSAVNAPLVPADNVTSLASKSVTTSLNAKV